MDGERADRLIEAQFTRAVDIVQSLPKAGPIQSTYDEKLAMYSLYKQATEGNVKAQRPGIFDMLGRAKWDAWAKQRDTPQNEAKWMYVDVLLTVLRKYSDRQVAQELIRELESFADVRGRKLDLSASHARDPSPSSSTSSYHSSAAHSLPDPMAPPDPSLPAPDVSPAIIPPSHLSSSHRSLLQLSQPASPGLQPLPNPLYGASTPTLGMPLQALALPRSRAQSSIGWGADALSHAQAQNGRRQGSIQSLGPAGGPSRRSRPPAPSTPLGLVNEHSRARQFTPDVGQMNLPPPSPAPPSTFSYVPHTLPDPSVTHSLQQIQTSLTALHERLAVLERTQHMLLSNRDRSKWSGLARFFGAPLRDEDGLEVDDEEDDRWRSQRVTTRTQRRPLGIRLVWYLLSAVRRALVDVGVGLLIVVVAVSVVGRLRRFKGRSREIASNLWADGVSIARNLRQ